MHDYEKYWAIIRGVYCADAALVHEMKIVMYPLIGSGEGAANVEDPRLLIGT